MHILRSMRNMPLTCFIVPQWNVLREAPEVYSPQRQTGAIHQNGHELPPAGKFAGIGTILHEYNVLTAAAWPQNIYPKTPT